MAARALSLLLLALLAQTAMADSSCKRVLLTEDQSASLATVVMRHTGIAANLATVISCKGRSVAWLETFRAPAGEGTQKWFDLTCHGMVESWPERWSCIEFPHLGFQAETYPGELGVWVDIPADATLDDARRDVALVFKLLAGTGDVSACEADAGAAKTVESMRADFTQGPGKLTLSGSSKEIDLQTGMVILTITRPLNASDAARIKCWSLMEVLVTS